MSGEGGWVRLALLVMVFCLGALLLVPDLRTRVQRVAKRYIPPLELASPPVSTVQPVADAEWVADNARDCDAALPHHGASVVLPGTDVARKNTLHSRLFVSNEHKFPVVVVLTDKTGNIHYQAVSLHPRRGAQMMVPVGRYGVIAQVGRSWCNVHQGFSDGVVLQSGETLHIRDGEVAKMRLMSFGNEPKNLAFSFSRGLGVALSDVGIRPEGHGKLDLQLNHGHFYVDGTVNQQPLMFLVDTGATISSIPADVAAQAGVNMQDCVYSMHYTANGTVNTCQLVVSELTIAQFRFRNVAVSVSQKLPSQPLLGMNIISQFHVEHQGDVMRMSQR